MPLSRLLIISAILLCTSIQAERLPWREFVPIGDERMTVMSPVNSPEKVLLRLLQHRPAKNKKLIAALLAFPFPFGIVGLHRIYLGCSPHKPVVYIATVGGGFGLLPFIDFWVLLTSKDASQYMNSGQVFMWLK